MHWISHFLDVLFQTCISLLFLIRRMIVRFFCYFDFWFISAFHFLFLLLSFRTEVSLLDSKYLFKFRVISFCYTELPPVDFMKMKVYFAKSYFCIRNLISQGISFIRSFFFNDFFRYDQFQIDIQFLVSFSFCEVNCP